METLGIILGFCGIVLTAGIAIHQYIRANKAEAKLYNVLNSLPAEISTKILQLQSSINVEANQPFGLLESGESLETKIVDLDNDGAAELLVQYPFGVHNTVLQVFGFRDRQFNLITELEIDTPAGFWTEDKDNDGNIEVITHQVSLSADLPYVMGFRDEVWYRLENNELKEVNRINLFSSDDLNKAKNNAESWLNNE